MYNYFRQKFSDQVWQYIFFTLIFIGGNLAIWTYYSTLLLRVSNNDLSVVFLNLGMVAVGTLIGFLLVGRIFPYLGYLNSFRLGNVLSVAVCIFTLLTLDQIIEVHLILAILRGLANGFFWAPRHMFNTRELGSVQRRELLGRLYAAEEVLTILLPPLAGALISLRGYEWLFVLGAVMFSIAALFPGDQKVKRSEKMLLKEMQAVMRLKGFRVWAAFTFTEELAVNLRTLALAVIPFLLIKDEFDVGLLIAGVGVIGALLAFSRSHDEGNKQLEWGLLGGFLITASSIFFLFFWNIPGLIIRSLLTRLGAALYVPVHQEYAYRLRAMLIGDFKDEFNVEIQEYSEIFLFIARMVNMLIISWLLFFVKIDQELLLKIIFAISLVREIPVLMFAVKLQDYLKR